MCPPHRPAQTQGAALALPASCCGTLALRSSWLCGCYQCVQRLKIETLRSHNDSEMQKGNPQAPCSAVPRAEAFIWSFVLTPNGSEANKLPRRQRQSQPWALGSSTSPFPRAWGRPWPEDEDNSKSPNSGCQALPC